MPEPIYETRCLFPNVLENLSQLIIETHIYLNIMAFMQRNEVPLLIVVKMHLKFILLILLFLHEIVQVRFKKIHIPETVRVIVLDSILLPH